MNEASQLGGGGATQTIPTDFLLKVLSLVICFGKFILDLITSSI